MSAITVYSLKVEHPIKWYRDCPLQVKREVPSGILPWPWVSLILLHTFVLGDKQNLQSPHCGMYKGMTWSPKEYNFFIQLGHK